MKPEPVVIAMLPTKVWIEPDMWGDMHVMRQHDGCKPFTYCSFFYGYEHTDNATIRYEAEAMARRIGATDPIEYKPRPLSAAPTPPAQPAETAANVGCLIGFQFDIEPPTLPVSIAIEPAQPAETVNWKIPDEPELFKFINDIPILQSLLYDINLLPEKIQDPVRWGYLVSLCSHYEMAIINAVPQPAEGKPLEWMPIETAPKDGAMFLCWISAVRYGETDEGQLYQQDASQIDFCWWRNGVDGNGYFDPACGQIGDSQDVTHWMPLPAPPENGIKGES